MARVPPVVPLACCPAAAAAGPGGAWAPVGLPVGPAVTGDDVQLDDGPAGLVAPVGGDGDGGVNSTFSTCRSSWYVAVMAPRPKVIISWSSGKDSALALHEVRRGGEVEIVGILTTITSEFSRVSMHGVRETLLDQQAQALGLPCWKVSIPSPCPNEVYERVMARTLGELRELGVTAVVFGDLFLEDLRRYRETKLAEVGMTGLFPLWGRDTAALAAEMIDVGLRATITCLDPAKIDRSFAGRSFDAKFLDELPDGIDPCGENGEFHTFAWAGPMFSRPVPVELGEVVERDGFMFADLLPAASAV